MIDNIKNVPEIYTKRSRDYQLLLKLLDVVTNSVKFNADKITDIYDSYLANDKVLDFLATVYNFNPGINFNDDDLRYLLSGFGAMMKNKGSKTGIEQAISLVMKTQALTVPYNVVITNKEFATYNNVGTISYYVQLEVGEEINRTYLYQLLEYVLPIGYTIDIYAVERDESLMIINSPQTVRFFINKGDRNNEDSVITGQEMVSRITREQPNFGFGAIPSTSDDPQPEFGDRYKLDNSGVSSETLLENTMYLHNMLRSRVLREQENTESTDGDIETLTTPDTVYEPQ